MKKKDVDLNWEFGSIKIFKDDLDEIFQILSSFQTIELSDKNYTYESLEDLHNQRGNSVTQLQLSASKGPTGFARVRLTTHRFPYLTAYSEDEAEVAFHRIKALLEKRHRFGRFARMLLNLHVALIAFTSSAVVPLLLKKPFPAVSGLILIVLLLWGSLALVHSLGLLTRVYLVRRHEVPSFISRNKDEIWKAILFGAAGSVMTKLYDYLTKP